eukprot:COSAG01_NODE_11872_length_1843_cov_16.877961_1_plen_48_part_10
MQKNELFKDLKEKLSRQRLTHTYRVAETAIKLAKNHKISKSDQIKIEF